MESERATPSILRSKLSRRTLLGLMGLGGVGLLAACSSEGSTGGGSATATRPAQTGAAPTTAAAAAATTPPAPKKGGILKIAVDQEPPTLDPHASPSAITYNVTASASESLLYLDDKRELKPWLAESHEVAPDGKTFTFKLRKDVKFHDDTVFNAQAVKWNFDRIVDPNFKAGASLGNLAGYDKSEVVDESTVRISFKNTFVPFLTYAGGPFLVFISPEGTPKQGDQVNLTPITTGPYKFKEWVAKDHATLTRWDGYTRRAPWADQDGPGYLDEIVWRWVPEAGTRVTTIESGENQVAAVIPSQDLPRLESSKDTKMQSAKWVGIALHVMLNTEKAPTNEVKVRQAIGHAIDRESMVNTVYKGTGEAAPGIIAQAMLEEPSLKSYLNFDLAKAKQLLDEAGWKESSAGGVRAKGGEQLKIIFNTIDYGGGPDPTSQFIQGQLRQAGVDVEIKAQARAPFYEDNWSGATHATTIFFRIGEWDALYTLFHSAYVGQNFNSARLKDAQVDQMLDQGRVELDTAKRRQIYVDIQKRILELGAAVPLIDQYSVWALRSNVDGLKFNGFTYPIVSHMHIM